MDLIVPHRKSRFRQINLCCAILFLVACLHISVVHSWRITQKCPHGHYFNDGCTACWCDTRTGQTKCERLLQCTRITPNDVKCPQGRQYKDKCGNDCTCYESTGAVFCNEKRRCPHDDTKPPFQILHSTTVSSVGIIPPNIITKNTFLRRNGGILGISSKPLPPIFVSSTPSPPPNYPPVDNNLQGFHSRMGEIESDNNNERISVSSTPRPHLKIPVSNSRSEELIIEPAIIIRRKGSNKASVVRNPSSAASIHLTHSNITPRSAPSLAPLQLYENQLRRILDIRRAYTNFLRSKVNLNLQIATGKTPMQVGSSSQQNLPFNRIVVLQEKNNNQQMDHPRRFDENYFNNNSTTSITPMTPFPIQHGQTVKPLIWRKEIKKVLNNFSPVPPIKQIVNYVTTSTESYLSQFLNHLNKNRMDTGAVGMTSPPTMESTTTLPPPPPTARPIEFTLPPSVTYPYSPFSTIEPFHESNSDPTSIPIHEVYQNHNFKTFTTATPGPMPFSYNSRSGYHHNPPPRFPYMTQLMEEIVRVDQNRRHPHNHGYIPIPTPRTSPALTALPTFQTPGPPYAEIDVVQPLSFLPPPNPEPATPTRRTMITSNGIKFSLPPPRPPPTVRVNIDKPIYITPPPSQNNRYVPPPPPRPPIFPPPQHNRRLYSTYPMNTLPTNQNNYNSFHYQPERQPPPPPPPLHQDHFRNYQQNPPQFRPSPLPNYQNYPPPRIQYFIPSKRPKQYRLTLKGSMREAATRVDDVVPRFVSRIANEFFKKPEIYVPKFRPGKPLTLEKVILNHKEIVPKEVSFGGVPTKLRFSPEAQWTMKEDMAKQGIMINEPLISSHPTILPGDNVMELDAPVRAVPSWETHTKMNVGTMQNTRKGGMVPSEFRPILLPSLIPMTEHPPTLDHQHQQEIQHQLMLAQQNLQNQLLMSSTTTTPPMDIFNDHQFAGNHHDTFSVDTSDYNDWHKTPPPEFYPTSENGEEQIIVDKYVVHDPNDGTNHDVIITSTTAAPPIHDEISPYFFNHNLFHKNGYPTVPAPTPPSVLIRHHGAPSPTTTEAPLSMPLLPQLNHNSNNNKYFVTVINSTPSPIPFVTTTISPLPSVGSATIAPITGGSIADQIHEMLHDQMDFGARPQQNIYDFLFQSRTGTPPPVEEDQMTAAATKMAGEVEEEKDKIDTEKVANIFSMDYKQSVGRKPPEVIVIRVPAGHSDGPFPKVVEKRGDAANATTEKSIVTTTITTSTTTETPSKSTESTDEQYDEPEEDDSAEERRRKRKRKRRRRKKKKKKSKARRRETVEESDEKEVTTTTSTTEISTSSTMGSILDGEAEGKFQKELDWKSQLMANICEINPSSPLCLTYRSICLLMTSEEAD